MIIKYKGNDHFSGLWHVLTGDEVYVKAVDPTNGASTNMYGATDEVYSTFSGYMVAPVYEEFPSVVG